MSFVDRISQYPNRFTLTDVDDGTTQTVDMTRAEGTVATAGTLLNKSGIEAALLSYFGAGAGMAEVLTKTSGWTNGTIASGSFSGKIGKVTIGGVTYAVVYGTATANVTGDSLGNTGASSAAGGNYEDLDGHTYAVTSGGDVVVGSASSGDVLALAYIPAEDRLMTLADAVKLMGVDFVVEEGSETNSGGTWYYRKWASGKVEAWAAVTKSSVAITTSDAAYGGYRTSAAQSITIPSGIFGSTPFVVGVKSNASGADVRNLAASSATALSFMACAGSSLSGQTIIIRVYAWTD